MQESSTKFEDVLAAIANPETPDRLNLAVSRFASSRQAVATHIFNMLKIASVVESELKILKADFLRDNKMPEDQMSAFALFDEKVDTGKDTLSQGFVTLGLLEKFALADDITRDRILFRIAGGQTISEADIVLESALLKLSPDELVTKIRDDALSAGTSAIAARKRADLLSGAQDLYQILERFRDGSAQNEKSNADIREGARQLLLIFEEIFGTNFADVPDWFLVGIDDAERMYLSQAHFALTELAAGQFDSQLLQKSSRHYSWSALDGIGFLAGKPSQFVKQQDQPPPVKPDDFQELTAIELCARTGLGALGLEAAKYRMLAVNELNKKSIELFERLRGDWKLVQGDITNPEVLSELTKLAPVKGRLTLLSGSLPKSPLKTRYSDSVRAKELLSHTQMMVEALRPRAFLFEVHKDLRKPTYKKMWASLEMRYRELGYHAQVLDVQANDFGIRQTRTFTFLIGIEQNSASSFKRPKLRIGITAPLRNFVGDLPFPHLQLDADGAVRVLGSDALKDQNDYTNWHSTWMARFGDSTQLFPDISQFQASSLRNSWTALGINPGIKSAPTAVGPMASSALVPLDFELACRIQGIPLDWEIPGRNRFKPERGQSRLEYVRECNLMVKQTPPQVVYGMAQAIRAALTGEPVDKIDLCDVEFSGARYRQGKAPSMRQDLPLTGLWKGRKLADPERTRALEWRERHRAKTAAELEDLNDIEIPVDHYAPTNSNPVRYRSCAR